MKRFLLSFLVLSFSSVFFTKAAAQSCNIGSVVIANNKVVDGNPSDGKCEATFDASFTINNSSGNNDFIFIQTFIATAIRNGAAVANPNPSPNYFGCNNGTPTQTSPPNTISEIGNPLLNIVIDNSGATPVLANSYLAAPGIIGIRGVITGTRVEREDLGNGNFRFTLIGLKLDMPYDCSTGTEYTYTSNVFTTRAEDLSTVNCVNCGVTTEVPSLAVTGTLNCSEATINFNNFSNSATTVNYSLYADVDGDGFLNPTTSGGVDLLISTPAPVSVAANTVLPVNVTIPNTFSGRDVLVAVSLGAGLLVHELTTLACPTQSCNIGDVFISNTKVTDNSGSDGICRATFDASFTIAPNANNRFIFIQTYVASATRGGVAVPNDNQNPNYFGCTNGTPTQTAPPNEAAEIGNPLLNIVIDNSGTTPTLATTYVIAPGVIGIRGVTSTSQIIRETLPNGEIRFTLTGLQLDMPNECNTNTEYTYVSSVFTTASANATTVNCVNCGVTTTVPSLEVSGTKNCNALNIRFNNFSAASMDIEYSVYADTNGDGIFTPVSVGGTDQLIITRTESVLANTVELVPSVVPDAYRDFDVFIAVNLNGAQSVVFVPSVECAPLPVTFKSFNAKRVNSQVTLTWETAMESNNRGFSVQRNTGGGWVDVSFVATKANGGNSSSVLAYEFIETNNQKSVTQYRLLQVDIDGKSKASEIRSVRGLSQVSRNMIYPNPSNDGSVNIIFDDERGNRDVLISDMGGRIVKQYRNVSASTMRVDQLNPGMYSVRVINQATGAQSNEKLVINK